MRRVRPLSFAAVVCIAAAGLTAQQPTFRSRVTMVPIDVRVIDSDGNPITDLTAKDFTITENGQRQQVSHFSSMTLTAETAEAGTTPTFERVLGARTDALVAQNRRVFLILIGRGRVIGTVNEIEALEDFVGTRLLPQDLVAVQAYNRATPFTGDHAAVAQLLAHFRERNAQIESAFESWFGGLRAKYGPPGTPSHIQQQIDALFASVTTLATRTVSDGPLAKGDEIDRDTRATADQLQRAADVASRPQELLGRTVSLIDSVAANTAEQFDLAFDEYVSQQATLRQDVRSLFAGINYLRHIEGEKHLVFVTRTGVSLPRMEQNQSLAAVAADGRVALSIIFTGGPVVAPRPMDIGPARPIGQQQQASVASASQQFQRTFLISELREMTAITGGQLAVYQDGAVAVDRIDRATRFQYLLGYHSSNAVLDGRYRDVRVAVNRRGATVLHRRGYFASERLVPMDRQAFVTASRIAEAGVAERDIEDILVTVTKATVEGRGADRHLVVDLHVRAPNMGLVEQDGRRVGALDLALFVADGRQRHVGTLRQRIDLSLPPEVVERFLAEGVALTVRVPIDGEALYLKVIAYDYAADLIGTATRTLR